MERVARLRERFDGPVDLGETDLVDGVEQAGAVLRGEVHGSTGSETKLGEI